MNDIITMINNGNWNEVFDQLKKSDKLFDHISNGKNLFHYACMRGNIDIINKFLNIKTSRIYLSDNDGNTGFHLLAINEWDNILTDKISLFPKFLKLKNNEDDFIFNIVLSKYDLFKKIILLMIEMKYEKYLNYINGFTKKNIILDIIDICVIFTETNKKYFEILTLFDKIGIDFASPKDNPPLIYSINNNYVDMAKFILTNLNYQNKHIVNVFSNKQLTPLILSLKKSLTDLVMIILNLDVDVNYSGIESKYVPLSIAFKNGMLEVSERMIKMTNIDFDKRDNQLNTPIYYLIKYIAHIRNTANKDVITKWKNILDYLIEKSDLQNLNINNETPFHLLVKFKMWEQFKEKLSEKQINLNLVNKYGYNPLTYLKSDELPKLIDFVEKSLKKNITTVVEPDNITLPKVNESDGFTGLFNSDGIHNIIYLINFINKYDNLLIPIQLPIFDKIEWDKYIINYHETRDEPYTNVMYSLVFTYFDTFYTIMPCMIFWKDKNLHYYTKNSLYLIRAISQTKRFVVLRITIIVTESVLHANIAMYDKLNNKIIRFEPYGDWEFHDSYNLDDLILRIFKSALDEKLHESLKYIRPSEYLDKTKFQTTSMGDHPSEKNLGDPMGYCLAWCFWFMELKLLNPDVTERKLVSNALEKIIRNDNINKNPLLTYIRAYSKQLDKGKNNYLKNIGISENEIYKVSYTQEKLKLIKIFSEKNAIDKILK